MCYIEQSSVFSFYSGYWTNIYYTGLEQLKDFAKFDKLWRLGWNVPCWYFMLINNEDAGQTGQDKPEEICCYT
jgi:hypothetical protein